ncbi:hypothetical protein CCP3SC15_400002 [Gammaproteobacteria bacterium]
MILAEKWGKAPWEVTGETLTEKVRQTWWARANLFYSQLVVKGQIDNER